MYNMNIGVFFFACPTDHEEFVDDADIRFFFNVSSLSWAIVRDEWMGIPSIVSVLVVRLLSVGDPENSTGIV